MIETVINAIGRVLTCAAVVWFAAFVIAVMYYACIDPYAHGEDSNWWFGWVPVALMACVMSAYEDTWLHDLWLWIRHG